MSYQPNAPIGVDDPLSLDNTWRPQDQGLIAWSFDPGAVVMTSVALTPSGIVWGVRLKLSAPASITNLHFYINTAGATLTANQCIAGLYQGTKLVGSTADQSSAWTSTGLATMALVGGPFRVNAGDVVVAFYYNGTTGPALSRASSVAGVANMRLASPNLRYFTADTGRTTTLPDPLGAQTALNIGYWAGVS